MELSNMEIVGPENDTDPPMQDSNKYTNNLIGPVPRKLTPFTIRMITIAGTIGTGVFLNSGQTFRSVGPLGAVLAYIIIGSVSYCTVCSVAEMATYAPVSGSFAYFAGHWVDPALGYAVGMMYWLTSCFMMATEIIAAVLLTTSWIPVEKQGITAAFTAGFSILIILINFVGPRKRLFSRSEQLSSIMKSLLMMGFILAGICFAAGGNPKHEKIGFRYWHNPGVWSRAGLYANKSFDRFLGFMYAFIQAGFSYQGLEMSVIAADQTINPRQNIYKSAKLVCGRIIVFYVLAIFMIGLLVPSNDPRLRSDPSAAVANTTMNSVDNSDYPSPGFRSPLVIACKTLNVKALPAVINVLTLFSALATGNTYLFSSTCIFYGLAKEWKSRPLKYHMWKIPFAALGLSSLFVFLSFFDLNSTASNNFQTFQTITASGGFCTWFAINLTYIKFYQTMKKQQLDPNQFNSHNRFQPYLAYWGCLSNLFLLIANMVYRCSVAHIDGHRHISNYSSAFVSPGIFIALYCFHKAAFNKPLIKPDLTPSLFFDDPGDTEGNRPQDNRFYKLLNIFF